MRIACYKGKSAMSRCIRFLTRSEYSHAAFVFDEAASRAAWTLGGAFDCIQVGAVVEAWQSGIRNVASLSRQHTPGTTVDVFAFAHPLSGLEELHLAASIARELGKPYDFRDVLAFVTRRRGTSPKRAGRWFCSELVFAKCAEVARPLFGRTKAWEVPPGWIPRSPLLRFAGTEVTK